MNTKFADYLEQQYGKEVADQYRALVESPKYRSAKGGYAKHDKKDYFKPNFDETCDRKRK